MQTFGQTINAAFAADKAQNYSDAMRFWRAIDAEPEVDVAFAGIPLTANHAEFGRFYFGTEWRADDYSAGHAQARRYIGWYYERGLGVPQDYAEAARWYQKSIDTKDIHGELTLPGRQSKKNLGLLYAYGLGVPRDRARARQIWVSMGPAGNPNANDLVILLDNNALPKSMTDDAAFWQEVQTASAPLLAAEQRKREEAETIHIVPQTGGAPSSGNGGSTNKCTAFDYKYAVDNPNTLQGLRLAYGCH